MSPGYGATLAKRRLSRRLRELREGTDLTANQVCARLSWGRGKVGRFEANVWKRPELSDVRDLLRIYRVSDSEREELEELARQARARPWWRDYHDVFGETEFPGFEDNAERISLYMPLILPGLLQTPAYTEAQMDVATQSPEWRRRALEARALRQRILDRPDDTTPHLVAVITEASLLYRWGTSEQRRAQLRHLVRMSERPHVELRLLRFEDGPHPGMCGPINIFDFPAGEPQAVFIETDFAIQEVVGKEDIAAYVRLFDRIRQAARDAASTRSELRKMATDLE